MEVQAAEQQLSSYPVNDGRRGLLKGPAVPTGGDPIKMRVVVPLNGRLGRAQRGHLENHNK
ncbi:hypothetical protein NHX12_007242, partial [Muraenolepis orangiensis]